MKLKLLTACFSLLLMKAPLTAQGLNSDVVRLNKTAGERQDARDWDSAEHNYLHALDIAAKSEAGHTVATLHQNLGILYLAENRYTDAEKQYWLAYDLLKAEYGEQHPTVGLTLNKIGELTCLEGHFTAASSLFQRSIGILKTQPGSNDVDTATVLTNLASAQWFLGNLSKAEAILDEAAALFKRAGNDEHPVLGLALQIRARIAEQEGNLPSAEAHYRKALLILEQSGGPKDVAAGLVTMGQLLLRQGNMQGAEANLKRALLLVTSDNAEESPVGAALMATLARCNQMQAKPQEANRLFERAIGIYQRLLGPDHPNLLYTMQEYAQFLRATKRKNEAKKLEAYVHDHNAGTERLGTTRNLVDVHQLLLEQKHRP
jgi:tetratricopeptide (TPR) repeat protein